MLQILADGIIIGSIVSLGAIGLSLTVSIFRFSNFSHGELLAWGAYLALVVNTLIGNGTQIGPFSFGLGLVAAMLLAVVLTGYGPGARAGRDSLSGVCANKDPSRYVIASFGASPFVLRSLLQYWQGEVPKYYSENLQMAIHIVPRSFDGGLRLTADQSAGSCVAHACAIAAALHVFLRYSVLGRSTRATAANPDLAQATGINPGAVFQATLIIGGALAAIAECACRHHRATAPDHGQRIPCCRSSPPIILGGVGSNVASLWGSGFGRHHHRPRRERHGEPDRRAEYRSEAAAFIVLALILTVKPNGLFGENN